MLGVSADDKPTSPHPDPLFSEEAQLSEVELRKLYDDEEIDRFLALFAAVRRLQFLVYSVRLSVDFV